MLKRIHSGAKKKLVEVVCPRGWNSRVYNLEEKPG